MTRRLVQPQCHEFDCNLNYNENGLKPYFGFAAAVSEGGGAVESTFSTSDGTNWDVTLRYTEGNLVPPGETTPGGARWNVGNTDGNVREFRLEVSRGDLRSTSFHVRPRWRGLEGETGDGRVVPIHVPESLVSDGDALSVRAQGSNIPFEAYPRLLRRASRAVGVTGYFDPDRVHRTSNIVDAARYLRVSRDRSGPIHSRTGPIQTLAHVLEGDREGFRKLVQNDETNHGENLPGWYHTATLGPGRVSEVFPSHSYPVEIKHYYAREALDRSKDDPLAHPKLEVSLQSSRWDGTVSFSDVEDLTREMDDWLYSIVQESLGEASLRAGYGGYISDGVWSPENARTEAEPVKLNLTEVRHEQESVVYRHLVDGMYPTDCEILETLVTDGGRVSPSDLSSETGRHQDTVYRSLQRMNDLVDHSYGEVKLQSTYISELVADALEEARSSVARAASAAAEAVHTAERGIDEKTSAFLAWQERYTEVFEERSSDEGGVRLDLGRVDSAREVQKLLRNGLDLWNEMNRDPVVYRMGDVKWRHDGEEAVRHGTIWKMLRGTSGGTRVVGTAPTTDW